MSESVVFDVVVCHQFYTNTRLVCFSVAHFSIGFQDQLICQAAIDQEKKSTSRQ